MVEPVFEILSIFNFFYKMQRLDDNFLSKRELKMCHSFGAASLVYTFLNHPSYSRQFWDAEASFSGKPLYLNILERSNSS